MPSLAPFTVLALAAVGHAYDYSTPGTYSVTPHDQYSSSIGVLGCKIDYDRVAYWPMAPDCEHMCVKVTHEGTSLTLLHIDQSGGAYDISYDAWSQLYCGVPGTDGTCVGGGVDMEYEWVDMAECKDLLKSGTGKLAFAAANSMNQLATCIDAGSNWTADNYELYNIFNPTCTLGHDETCSLDYPAENQPKCSPEHPLGSQDPLTTAPVYNVQYPNAGAGVSGGELKLAT